MDANEISAKHKLAEAARSSWTADALASLVAAGQRIVAGREKVVTASAPQRDTPFAFRDSESVGRLDVGRQSSGPRDLHSIVAGDKDRQLNNAVARARKMVEEKIAEMPISGPDILYLKADVSRWDATSGQPQTGRISFQIPFSGPQGDPRTIYASVDLVMGDLMAPKTFTDGLNNAYAFDKTGLTEMFQGQKFDIVTQPHVVPETKYTGPDFHAPDGIPGAVAAVSGPRIMKTAAPLVRTASGESPRPAREGMVRAISKEAGPAIAQPISPASVAKMDGKPDAAVRKPANAGTAFTIGTSAEDNRTDPHAQHTQGGQCDPTLASTRDVKINRRAMGEKSDFSLEEAAWRCRSTNYDLDAAKYQLALFFPEATKEEIGKAVERAYELSGLDGRQDRSRGAREIGGSLSELREVGFDGAVRSVLGSGSLDEMVSLARTTTYGGHDYPVEIWSAGKMVQRVASVRTASKTVDDLLLMDMRMVSFNDYLLLRKQRGESGSTSFEAAAKELAKSGITLYKSAAPADARLPRRLAQASMRRIAEDPAATAPASATPNPNVPNAAPGTEAGQGMSQSQGGSEYAPPKGLDSVAMREWQAVFDQYKNEKETINERENKNVENGLEPHIGIDYSNLQLLADKLKAYNDKAEGGVADEMPPDPSAPAKKPMPTESPASMPQPSGAGPAGNGTTMMPDKGMGLASRKPGVERFAGTLCAAQVAAIAPAKKTAAYELDDDAKTQMTTMNKDPNKPEDVTEFMDTFKKTSSRSPQFPEVCKNCKDLVVPVGYSRLKEYQHTRLPFCGAEKKPGVGFTAAYFRDCLGYDPIVKDIPQKVDMKAPESEQTDKDMSKGMKEKKAALEPAKTEHGPGYHKGDELYCAECGAHKNEHPRTECPGFKMGSKPSSEKKAAALPSMDPEAVTDHDGHTGHGLDIREWCEKGGHYAPAGDAHPTHDWCTLWNTAVENLVMLPGGAVVPRSMSGMSSEPMGEGGASQFGRTQQTAE